MPESPLVIFFGHHKCGSRFFRESVMTPLAEANSLTTVAYHITDPPFHFRLAHDLDLHHIDFEAIDRADPPHPTLLNLANAGRPVVDRVAAMTRPWRGIHVVRDPRQVLVSNYFHHLRGHDTHTRGWVWDELLETRAALETLDLEAGLLYEMDHITRDVLENQLFAWRPDPRVLEFKLEDCGRDPAGVMRRVADHTGLDAVPDPPTRDRSANPEAQPWSDVLTPKLKRVFKDRYNDQLVVLGYADDPDW